MNAILDSGKLRSGLERVGLKAGEPLDIGNDALADTWTSDYAELYLVKAPTLAMDDVPALLSLLDGAVAKRLRQQRDSGRFLDAHVCIIVSPDLIRGGRLTLESDASRYVSRKYWIDHDVAVEEILRRLTLTWVDVDASPTESGTGQMHEFADLRKRIASRKGAGAASDFLEALAI